jgi:hypothetical protein
VTERALKLGCGAAENALFRERLCWGQKFGRGANFYRAVPLLAPQRLEYTGGRVAALGSTAAASIGLYLDPPN